MQIRRHRSLSIVYLTLFLSFPTAVPLLGQVQKVADGFQFLEGPLWKEGTGLLFSDLNANTIYRWSQASGTGIFIRPSGGSNGLAFDNQGRLLAALQGGRQVVRFDSAGNPTILASHYQGKRLNSPNDLVVKSDGSIWFTDPPYGISSAQEELHFYGIFRITPTGELQLLDKTLTRPNGIAFSPDETRLYASDAEVRVISVWDVIADTAIGNKRTFASIALAGYADGMKVDPSGNLFATGPLGVWVWAPDGHLLDTILVPGQTTNCNWGDADRKTLYITSGAAVYSTRPAVTGLDTRKGAVPPPSKFPLLENFPNPFNPGTEIHFRVPETARVSVRVYDLLGRELRTLVEDQRVAGEYGIRFDGSDLHSGMYLCRLHLHAIEGGGEQTAVSRIVLLK